MTIPVCQGEHVIIILGNIVDLKLKQYLCFGMVNHGINKGCISVMPIAMVSPMGLLQILMLCLKFSASVFTVLIFHTGMPSSPHTETKGSGLPRKWNHTVFISSVALFFDQKALLPQEDPGSLVRVPSWVKPTLAPGYLLWQECIHLCGFRGTPVSTGDYCSLSQGL